MEASSMMVEGTGDMAMTMEMEITNWKGPYYFTVNMIACDDVPIILFFHMLFILDMINMLE